jgi:YegS/Rv2252/BmrU family lipid kinase
MNGTPGRALVIINEHSRGGKAAAKAAVDALRSAGMTVDHRTNVGRNEIADVIRSVRDSVDCVILGGGDGTLNTALPGLLDTGLPLGVIPLGTANDLARTLRLPLDVAQAVQVVSGNILRDIDVGEVNGIPFLNVASIGFGVDLTRALTRDAKRRWGVFGYLIAGLRVLRRMRPFHVTVKIGETVHRSKTVHLAVGNGRHYGGGMVVSEDAAIDDDRLDVYSLEVPNAWALLKILPSMRIGRHGRWSEVETMAGQEVAVETRKPRSVNADGEIVTQTPAHFRVLRGALKVYVPSAV